MLHNQATEEGRYLSIKGETNFELTHTTSATRRLRNICLKGRVDSTNTISWWNNEAEFAEYCMGLKSPCNKAVDNLTYNVRRIADTEPQPKHLWRITDKVATSEDYKLYSESEDCRREAVEADGEVFKAVKCEGTRVLRHMSELIKTRHPNRAQATVNPD